MFITITVTLVIILVIIITVIVIVAVAIVTVTVIQFPPELRAQGSKLPPLYALRLKDPREENHFTRALLRSSKPKP